MKQLFSYCIFIISILLAQNSFAKLEVPVTKYNFGEVKEGEIVEHSFKVINQSNNPVNIESVKPDCGCTVPEYSKTIAPKSEGFVKLKVNTKGFKGNIIKTTTIRTNDDTLPQFTLVLEGKVLVAIDVSTNNILFYGPDTKGQKKTVTIVAQKEVPLELVLKKNTLGDKIAHTLVEKVKGKSFELVLECLEGPEASFHGELVFDTNYQDQREIVIRVRKMPLQRQRGS